MPARHSLAVALAVVLACAAAAAGCGGGGGREGDGARTTEAGRGAVQAGARSGAAELRARFTALLTDHAHLLGFTLNAGLAEGLSSDAFRAGAAVVDRTSVQLADALAGIYGRETGERFLRLWRRQVGLLVDDARGRALGDPAARAQAARRLAQNRRRLGTLLAAANPNLPAEAVAEELEPFVGGLRSFVAAAVDGSPAAYDRLREAAANTAMTAKVLADGIAQQRPDRFDGSALAGASELRGTLTGLLSAHLHVIVAAAAAGAGAGFDGEAFGAARLVLETQAELLGATVEDVFGEDAGRGFLERWRGHDAALLEYARAQAGSDRTGAAAALADLEASRTDLAGFLATVSPQLPAGVVAEALDPPLQATTAAIRAAVKGSPQTFDRLHDAAALTPATAALLADGIARQFPRQFPPA